MKKDLYAQMPVCRSLSAGRTETEELDAAIRRDLEGLGYGE